MAAIKKTTTADWTNFLGSSDVPGDDFNFQTGNNFGLDAFQFDVQDNQGPEDGGRLPSTRGMAGLPDGTIPMDRDAGSSFTDLTDDSADGLGMDFTSMLSYDEGNFDRMASLTDLQWLDPTQAPDLNRLPNNEKTLNSIPTLEEAWGHGQSSSGTRLTPNRDREAAQYENSINSQSVSKVTSDDVKVAVQKAMRRAHYGDSINAIQSELVDSLGNDAHRAASAMGVIRDEHGLIGRVFVRASAFPGIKNGKWVDHIKSKSGSARYVITDDIAVADKLGMKMVSEVPWDKALRYYAPRLAAAGYRIASSDMISPMEKLRMAYAAGPVATQVKDSMKPIVKPVVASAEDASAAIKAKRPTTPYIMTANDHAVASKRKSTLIQIARWVKEGKLSREDALKIHNSGSDSISMYKAATDIITAGGATAVYDGVGTSVPMESHILRARDVESFGSKTAELDRAMMKKAQVRLVGIVKAGMLTMEEARRVADMSVTADDLSNNMAAAVQAAGAMRQLKMETVKSAEYRGPIQKAAVQTKVGDATHIDPYMQLVMKAAAEHNIKTGEIIGYLKWTRQRMAEGEMGKDLTDLTKARFALPLRKAALSLYKEVRSAHEGLSGHLYVDAGAYMTANGTKGCEEGAAKHRSNSIKYVLSTSRCSSCVNANSEGVCSQYNKYLTASAPVDNPKEYQAEAIRMANASEPEVVASMFNQNEFGLQNDQMEEVHVSSYQAPEKMGEVLFGGMEV